MMDPTPDPQTDKRTAQIIDAIENPDPTPIILATAVDREHRTWTIEPMNGGGSTDLQNARMTVTHARTDLDEATRLHELAHATWTNRDPHLLSRLHNEDGRLWMAAQACEDRRIHHLMDTHLPHWHDTHAVAMLKLAKQIAKQAMDPFTRATMDLAGRQTGRPSPFTHDGPVTQIVETVDTYILEHADSENTMERAARLMVTMFDALDTDPDQDEEPGNPTPGDDPAETDDPDDPDDPEPGDDTDDHDGPGTDGESDTGPTDDTDQVEDQPTNPIPPTPSPHPPSGYRPDTISTPTIYKPKPTKPTGNLPTKRTGNDWATMETVTHAMPIMNQRERGDGRGRTAELTGTIPKRPGRLLTGGKAFTRKKPGRRRGGTILIDISSSMSMDSHTLDAMMEHVRHGTVATYHSRPGAGRHIGILEIIAANERRAANVPTPSGGNVCDGPALAWLARQPEPRIWISDGEINGRTHHDPTPTMYHDARTIIARYHIQRYDSTTAYLNDQPAHPTDYPYGMTDPNPTR